MEFHSEIIITQALFLVGGAFIGALFIWLVLTQPLKLELREAMFEKKSLQDKLELLEQNKEQLKLEFRDLAHNILEQNSQKFSNQNIESLHNLMEPFKAGFSEFKKHLNELHINELKDRATLLEQINSIKEINQLLSKEANELTNALKSQSKTQGLWGEMVLDNILQNSGLRVGFEYSKELSLRSKLDEQLYRLDAVVHMPDQRDVIIDAKTSLSAYERVVNTDDELSKKAYINEHLLSVKNHIKLLSQKSYTKLDGINSLDFILMFIPIESALLLAMQEDNALFDEAYKKGILLVGPTSLLVSLRSIENSWRYENQHKNALEIASRAGLLYDKFVGFVESIDKIGKNLSSLQKSYDEATTKMYSGAGNVLSQFEKLKQLGAASSKELPLNFKNKTEE